MLEQVSIQAFGRAGRFWDLPEDEAVPTLAVVLHRMTVEGSRNCILPASTNDIVTVWNGSRPQKEKSEGNKASEAYMFGEGG